MREYLVSIPITGIASISVQADSEDEAIQIAIDNVTLDNIEQWEAHTKIVGGNVFYGMQNEAEAEEQ